MYRLIFIFLIVTSFCFSQTLSIASGNSISIDANSSVKIDGLELAPSATYTIAGSNAFDRTSTPIVVGDNSSINRVYTMTEVLSDYSGVVSFSYEESELNGISESGLILEVQDGNGVWNNAITQVQVSSLTMTLGDYLYSVVNQNGGSTSSSTNRINNYGQIGSGNLFVTKNGKIISY